MESFGAKSEKRPVIRFVMEDKQSLKILIWIVLAAVIVRILFVLFFPGSTENALLDSERYNRVATNLLDGNGFSEYVRYPTAFVPPVYPFFLAACYRIFGVHALPVKFIQAVLGGLLPLIVFMTGRRVFGNQAALIASILAAVYPEFVVMTGYLYTETFFILIGGLAFLFLLKAFHHDRMGDWLWAGLFMGLSILVRNLLFFFPLFLFLICLIFKLLRPHLKRILIMGLVVYTVPIPWTVRNYLVFNEVVPVTTGGGIEFWVGSDIAHEGRYGYDESRASIDAMTKDAKTETEKDRILIRAALRNIAQDPPGYARVCIGKAFRYFFQIYENIPSGKARTANLLVVLVLALSYYPILALGLMGIVVTRHRWRTLTPLYALFGYTLLLYSAIHFVPRYRIPVVPFLVLFTYSALLWMLEKLKNRSIQRR